MLNKIFWAGVGAVIMYLVMKNPESQAKLDSGLDTLRGDIHDLIKKYAPEADDQAIQSDVLTTVK